MVVRKFLNVSSSCVFECFYLRYARLRRVASLKVNVSAAS